MNRVAASTFNDIHNFVDAQITFARRRRADRVGFTGQAHMQGVAVGFAEHNGGWKAKVPANAQEGHRDFAPICNYKFFYNNSTRKDPKYYMRATGLIPV